MEIAGNWYSHIPKAVCEHEDVAVVWSQGVQTDREVLTNKLDNLKKDQIGLLIEVPIPLDRNVIKQEAENKLKHESIGIEIQRMWKLKSFVKTVIIEATRIVTKGIRNICKQYQENIQ
jgi:hypothetical protein